MKPALSGFVLGSLCLAAIALSPSQTRAAWPAEGLYLNLIPPYNGMTADAAGGIFLNWLGTVQRVSADGDLLLGPNGSTVADASKASPCCPDGQGGVFIALLQGTTLVLVRVGPAGTLLWTATCCPTATTTKNNLCVCPDGAGGALVAWSEARNLPRPDDQMMVYAQRVNAVGDVLWAADGALVRSGFEYPQGDYAIGVPMYVEAVVGATPAGVPGGALVFITEDWLFRGQIPSVTAVRPDGTVSGGGDTQLFGQRPSVVSDGVGGAYCAAANYSYGYLVLARFSSTGVKTWTTNIAKATQQLPVVARDSQGALVAWEDTRGGDDTEDIYAQKVTDAGIPLWTPDGVFVGGGPGVQGDVDIETDFGGGALVVWSNPGHFLPDADVYVQHLTAVGEPMLPPNGLRLTSAVGIENDAHLYMDPAGYGIVAWHGQAGVFAQRLSLATLAVAISDFTAEVRGSAVALAAEFRSDLGVTAVNIYRAVAKGGFVLRAQIGPSGGDHFEYIDDTVSPGTSYRYQLGVVDADGEFLSPMQTVMLPALETTLEQNQPNPFNPTTTIRFTLQTNQRAVLEIFATDGRRVRTLVDTIGTPGSHAVAWDGRDDSGASVSSGIYFYRLTSGKFTASRKMMLLK